MSWSPAGRLSVEMISWSVIVKVNWPVAVCWPWGAESVTWMVRRAPVGAAGKPEIVPAALSARPAGSWPAARVHV